MANSEHLKLLQEGVSVWNSWYAQHKKVVPDFSQANLSNLNLQGVNLKKANLSQANFNGTNLQKSQLQNADLERANLLGSELDDANLKGANLDYVIWSQANINRRTTLAPKYRKVFEIVNHQSNGKNFSGLDLSNSNLFRVDLSNAELSNTKLLNTNLTKANLNSAYLHKADLTGANLENADLRNAYFSHANLTSSYLGGALCCGTYFKDADLKFASLKAAKFSHKTMIDLKWYAVWEIVNRGAARKNLSGADLINANLQGVDFEEANLTNAKLNHAILRRSNLTNANLTNTDLAGANLCGVDLDKANLKGAKLKSIIRDQHTSLASRSAQLPAAAPQPLQEVLDDGPDTILQSSGTGTVSATSAISATGTMVKERVESVSHEEEVATLLPATIGEVSIEQPAKSSKNLLGIFVLAILATICAGAYVFFQQNPDLPLREQLKTWQEKVPLLN